MNAIQEPCRLTLYFPGGKMLQMHVKGATMTVRNNVLNHVALVPLENPVPFHEAVKRLRDWAKAWGILPNLSTKLDSWDTQNPASDILSPSYSATAPWDNASQLFAEIKPYSRERGWYIVLTFDLSNAAPNRVQPVR